MGTRRLIPVISGLVASVLLWFITLSFGFSQSFRFYYIGVVWVAVFLFLLLDAKPAKPSQNPVKNLAIGAGIIIVLSAVFIVGGLYIPSSGQYTVTPDEVKYKDKTKVEVGQIVFFERCVYCHKMEGFTEKTGPGPELSEIGEIRNKETLKAKISNPVAYPAQGYEEEWKEGMMPGYFLKILTEEELDALVTFLSLTPASLPNMEMAGMGHEEEEEGDMGHEEEEERMEMNGMDMPEIDMGHEDEGDMEMDGMDMDYEEEPFDLEAHLLQKALLLGGEVVVSKAIEKPMLEDEAPEFELARQVITAQGCGACHALKARGLELTGLVGPDLTYEAKRGRSDEWQLQHLKDSKSISEEDVLEEFKATWGVMPKYGDILSEEELNAVVKFLQSPGVEEEVHEEEHMPGMKHEEGGKD